MTVAKIAFSVDRGIAESARESARAHGLTVSRWIAEAMSHRLQLEAMDRFVACVEGLSNPLTEEEIMDADRLMYG